MEDAVRKKKEEQIREAEARKKAEHVAAMLPILALMKLMDSDSDSGKKVISHMVIPEVYKIYQFQYGSRKLQD